MISATHVYWQSLWFNFQIQGITWEVYLVNRTHPVLDGGELLGITLVDDKVIFIRADMPAEAVEETFYHERLHAIISECGAKNVIANYLNNDQERAHNFEETLIRCISPVMFDMDTRNMFTRRLPAKPKMPKKLGGG